MASGRNRARNMDRGTSGPTNISGRQQPGTVPDVTQYGHHAPVKSQREDVLTFEDGRIKALQEERLALQKKTFTKWINSFLLKVRMEVEDLFTDLADGKKLLKLLEIISGEKIGKPNNGNLRIHNMENVNKSLAFLHTKVRLESIGAGDIVDGNACLILVLIWTIILRFQIQEIEIDVDEESESSEKKSAKDALLLWCQRKTNGYPGVNIRDFTGSWRNGLGFNALIHAHRPDLIDFKALQLSHHTENLNNAFDIANNELGIPRLLDAEDMDQARPDEKSVIMYVAYYYHTFARMKNGVRLITKIMGQMIDVDNMKVHYEQLMSNLLEYNRIKVLELENHNFPNSLEGIQKELLCFKQYRTVEKPPKYKERSEIEALYLHINTQLKSLKLPAFAPQDGQLIHDLEISWESLEHAEYRREVALWQELLRQERLEQLNYKFERKSVLREGYLKEMIQVLSDPHYGKSLTQVDATIKKHEAISADILAREEQFHDLTNISDELVRENYHGKKWVTQHKEEVLQCWQELLQLLDKHKTNLTTLCGLMAMLREVDTVMATIAELQGNFQSEDVGPHLLGVEDLLQKQSLAELQVTSLGETQRRLGRQAQQFVNSGHREVLLLQQQLDQLTSAYDSLVESSKARRVRLEEARIFFHFLQDYEEEESWLVEKQQIFKKDISAKDLCAVLSLQQKHKALQDEMKARCNKTEQQCEVGRQLIIDKHPSAPEIESCIDSLQEQWNTLQELAALHKKQLEDAAEVYQFYIDANEAESWLNEKMALVASADYGEDEPSAQALLQRHRDLQGELSAYSVGIASLNSKAEKLVQTGNSMFELSSEPEALQELEQEEWVKEVRLVPQDYWEEEPVERIEHHTVLEDRYVPQVRSLYPFTGQGMTMQKGEVMLLLNKTNSEWWNVRKTDGTDGFVPAKYVREIEPKVVQIQVRHPEKICEMQRVKKTRMVKQFIPTRRVRPVNPAGRPVKRQSEDGNENVEQRQKKINLMYSQLLDLAQQRHTLLEDSIRLFGFNRECDDFEKWIKDMQWMLRAYDWTDNVEAAKFKFEKFLTDLSASSKCVKALDATVEEFMQQGHSQLDKIQARQKHFHQQWDHLNWLKGQKEHSLEGASSLELFNRTCDEARDWMLEKMTQLVTAELGPDLKTVQALQRRHQHLEHELAAVEEKVDQVNLLANSVKSSYPNEQTNVNIRQKEVQDIWGNVKAKALECCSRLEDAVGHQIFMNSSKNLLGWMASAKGALNVDEIARDVATAENLLKKHQELYDDIQMHEDKLREVTGLGGQLLQRNPMLTDVSEQLELLNAEHQAVMHGCSEKGDWLRQCLDLQLLNREADKIEASTSSHEVFLANTDLGESLDDVEARIKQHEDFESTLCTQDERLKAFSELADKLIKAGHYGSKHIDQRRNQVVARRAAVKEAAAARQATLYATRKFHNFSADVDDLRGWIVDKLKTVTNESDRDPTNLEHKLQKHKAFERELHANEGQLHAMNKTGQWLLSEGGYQQADVGQMLQDLNQMWEELVSLSQDKGRHLRQAAAQHAYNRTMEDVCLKLEEMELCLQSREVGTDMRHCKELLKKHQVLETDMSQLDQKISDLVELGKEMANEGHFDADNILSASRSCQEKFSALREPAKKHRAALEESLQFHKFVFELDAQQQWIKDHLPFAASEMLGQNLHQAQSLHKKHHKLETEIVSHQPMIDHTLASGLALIGQSHPETKQIESLCVGLQDAWQHLQNQAQDRSCKLDLSLKAQQFFFEAGEVESWLSEKNDVLSSTDYGCDHDTASKLLTKHKAVELELDTYAGTVNEMGRTADAMVAAKHPDAHVIATKQQKIELQMRTLQYLATSHQQRLMESIYRHKYFLESVELEQWIREQIQTAASEDYGKDYEHLLVLQNKFDDFQHRIEAGFEQFKQCEEFAKKLIASESPYAADIESRQEQLRECWQQLLGLMENRSQRLQAAGDVHCFNSDVAEALSRIQEKDAALSDDLGHDLNSVLALIRRHEGFENDLVALEEQLQVLMEDAACLKDLNPGQNAAQIAQKQNIVMDSWSLLQQRTANRREELRASCELQSFLTQVRDLMNWAAGLHVSMMTEEKVRDVASAQTLKAEHMALKADILVREDNFQAVVEEGKLMVQENHYAASEIQEHFSQLLEERNHLHMAWQHKKVHLDKLIDLQFFLRDAKQIDALSSSQEVALAGTDIGTSVDEVDVAVKKHEAFEKLLTTQEKRVLALQENGDKLLAQNHFESSVIARRLGEVVQWRANVHELCAARKQRLEDALHHAQFVRDLAEAESWIGEKQKKLEAEMIKGEVTSMEDKMKKLQKHKAFQAELTAHDRHIQNIKDKGDMLLTKKHKASWEIRVQMDQLLTAWNQLLQGTNNYGHGLDEAQDILDFNNQAEKLEAWIRDKEMMVQAGDTGHDYEHCLALQRKLDDVDSDMSVDDSRVKSIRTLADRLIRQGCSDTRSVQQRRDNLIVKWHDLQGALDLYRGNLARALEVHTFNRDVDDTSQRVAEKAVAMSTDDVGHDLAAVEQLQRKQEALERDMTAIEGKLKEHDGEARRLLQKYPYLSAPIRSKLSELQENWRSLQQLARHRSDTLAAAYALHKFHADLQKLDVWVAETIKHMGSSELPATSAEAEAMLELHQERKAEIDGRQEAFKSLKHFGMHLPVGGDQEDLAPSLAHLEELRRTLGVAWEERRQKLAQAYQLQVFREQADRADNWLAAKEVFLNNDDLGDSLSSVEALLRKHEAFEKTLAAQAGRVEELEQFAIELLTDNHYDAAGITQRLQAVCAHRDRLKESAMARRKHLQESHQLQQFLRNMYEVEAWLHQKQQVASDENYRDPSNLQSKIQKHVAFELELSANRGHVGAVTAEGEALIGAGHFASMEIQARLDELEAAWRELQDSSQLKRGHLNDAYQAQLFSRTLEELEVWMEEVELQLQSEDHGKDLASVSHLLKRHALLEGDVNSHIESVEQVKDTAAAFHKSHQFMGDEIQERSLAVIRRYRSLQRPMQIRRDNLEDALLLHQFLRDVDDELQWVAEKEPQASSTDLGTSLTTVQSLQKKHQALEAELLSREPVVQILVGKARRMIHSGHFAASRIEASSTELTEKMGHLRDLCSVRRLRLIDAVVSQMFYAEANEAEAWIQEKWPLLTSSDFGKDEDSVQSLTKKLEGVERDLSQFQHNIGKLAKLSKGLVDRSHYDSHNITAKQAQIEAQFSELQLLASQRSSRLGESLKLFRFLREADELAEWMGGQRAIAASEDCGRDVEHVELLIQKLNSFLLNLAASGGRVTSCISTGQALIAEGNPERERIQAKLDETQQLWKELRECAHARQEALAGAKQVRVFDHQAVETIGCIQEKDAALSGQGYGQDLETIQPLVRQQQVFETDLAAVKEQAQLFSCTLEELEVWMDEVELQLQSEDHGKDLASVSHLLKRHTLLEGDVNGHIEAVEQVKDTAAAFQSSHHFMDDEIQERSLAVIRRYRSLQQPMQIRRDNLEDALLLHQFLRDVDDELQWVAEKEPQASSTDLGTSLTTVQSLQKEHQALEAELLSREPVVQTLVRRAQRMIHSGHFAAFHIEVSSTELTKKMGHLHDLTSVRRLHLVDAVESQMFYAEANETEAWIQEKWPLLTSSDFGKDEDSVQSLAKKLEGVERDLSQFQHNIGKLAKLSKGLVDRSHYDSHNITAKQAQIEAQFSELQLLASQRSSRLGESLKLFRFLREADEVAEWMGGQRTVAASEDCGRDVEHVELLIQTFDSFLSSLASSGRCVTSCISMGQALIAEGNPERERIRAKLDETQQLWEDLRELAHARQEALAGAKLVHMFDHRADETRGWIQEKDAALSGQGYGQDLETIQALVRQHQVFERALAAVKEQVESVTEESRQLASQFPFAQEHIAVKQNVMLDAWGELLEKSAQRRDKLQQAEQLQAYFEEYRDLMAWINEMIAKVTAPDLTQDVPGAEALIVRHMEHRAEIDTCTDAFTKFSQTGHKLIAEDHFLAHEIEEKISILEQRKQLLNDTWACRQAIYNQNLDTQVFKRDADLLENWLISREPLLHDGKLGETIAQVDDLICKHEDFEKTFHAQEEKFSALQRVSKLEEAFLKQQQDEIAARQAEKERVEREHIEARKRQDVQRITEERRREDEQRQMQESRIGRDEVDGSFEQLDVSTNSSRLNTLDVPDLAGTGTLHKAGSVSQLFGNQVQQDVKHAESMNAELKKPKRTPNFTTQQHTQGFLKPQQFDQLDQLPPVGIQGTLDRKHELQSAGKKAPVRSWKTFYTVLCGQLLCFFRDHDDFRASKAATSPVIIFKAHCEKAEDYTKRKHVFRLCCTDGSEFLFLAATEREMEDWVNKISFHAKLPPSLQLLSYDDIQKNAGSLDQVLAAHRDMRDGAGDDSSASSRCSTPDLLSQSPKPTVPHHGDPPPVPTPSLSTEEVTLRKKLPAAAGGDAHSVSYHQNGVPPPEAGNWRRSHTEHGQQQQEVPPPLPSSASPHRPRPGSADHWSRQQQQQHAAYQAYVNVGAESPLGPPGREVRPSSLPPCVSPPSAGVGIEDTQHHGSPGESVLENEYQPPVGHKDKDKRPSVFSSWFRKKRATNL